MVESQNWRAKPERPALTPAFIVGFALWAACSAVYLNARDASIETCFKCGIIAGAASILATSALACRQIPKMVAIIVLSISLGTTLAAFDAIHVKEAANEFEQMETIEATVVLEEDSSATESGERALARLEGRAAPRHVTLYLKQDEPLLQGDCLHVKAKVHAVDFAESEYSWSRASSASLYVTSFELQDDTSPLGHLRAIRKAALEGFSEGSTESGMLKAVTCGYRHDINGSDEYRAFQTCGLAHLVAVSGAHLAIVAGIVLAAMNSLRAPRWCTVVATVGVMLAYLILSGLPASAIRATIMSSIGLMSFFGSRRPSAMNALGIGMCLMIASEAHQAVSASFCLSCLSTAGIILFSPLLSFWFERLPILRLSAIGQPLSLTFSAGILSQLYATSMFGLVPMISPLANIVCAPLLPLVCGIGIVGALSFVMHLPCSSLIGLAAVKCASLLDTVAVALSYIPYASIPFQVGTGEALAVSFAVAAVLWVVWLKLDARIVCLALFACAIAFVAYDSAAASGDVIVMLDVGQGDSILLRSQGQAMLVDTGNQDSMLISALGRNHVRHLDEVLLTHADDDHVGSLDALASCVEVDRVVVAEDMLTCNDESCHEAIEQAGKVSREFVGVSVGDEFEVGAFNCKVIWPHGFKDAGGNADSLCLIVSYDGNGDGETDATALFLGDAEKEELKAMLSEQRMASIDIIKVGHHGSKNGITAAEAERLHPEIALIGVGKHNRYGHPSEEVLNIFQDIGCTVFRTDEQGDIACSLNTENVSVHTMK